MTGTAREADPSVRFLGCYRSAIKIDLGSTCSECSGSLIPGLFATGVDDNEKLLADGAVDPHYQLQVSPDANFPGPDARVVNAQEWPLSWAIWQANGPDSRWIGARANAGQNNAPGQYAYRTTFDLTGFDPSTAELTGYWATDNNGVDILINEQPTGHTTPFAGFSFVPFTIDSGFVQGVNTLDFVLENEPAGPTPSADL